MKKYENMSGRSGIVSYMIYEDYIEVRFNSGVYYKYSRLSVGSFYLAEIKKLAEKGQGLNAFLTAKCRGLHSEKGSY